MPTQEHEHDVLELIQSYGDAAKHIAAERAQFAHMRRDPIRAQHWCDVYDAIRRYTPVEHFQGSAVALTSPA